MTHKEADLALHPVVGVVLQVGDAEKFPQARGFESLDPFFGVSKQGPCFTARERRMEVTRTARPYLAWRFACIDFVKYVYL